jgi:8-oxo-dGTP pyrophosphatase MutT (NUDIX family)
MMKAMKKLLQKVGILAWWLTLPALAVYLSRAERTRAVLHHDGKIVVVKGWLGSGRWVLPGGGLHKGEDPLEGALREIREETGLAIARGSLTKLAVEPYDSRGIHFTCHYFAAELPSAAALKPQLFEISEAAWVDAGSLNVQNSNPDVLAGVKLAAAKSASGNLLQ